MSPSQSLLVPGAQHECGIPRWYSHLALYAEKGRLGDITIGISLLGSGTDNEPPVFCVLVPPPQLDEEFSCVNNCNAG